MLIVTHKCSVKRAKFGPGPINVQSLELPMSSANQLLNALLLIIVGTLQKPIVKIKYASACLFIRRIMVLVSAGNLMIIWTLLLRITSSMDSIARRVLRSLRMKKPLDAHQLTILSMTERKRLRHTPVIRVTTRKSVNYSSILQIINLDKMRINFLFKLPAAVL